MDEQQGVNAAEAPADPGGRLKQLRDLYMQVDARMELLEAKWDEEKMLLDATEQKLIEAMREESMPKCYDEAGQLFSIRPNVHVSRTAGQTAQDMVKALRASKLEAMVFESYAPGTLKSFVKERWSQERGDLKPLEDRKQEQWDEVLPEPLRGKVRVFEEREIHVTSRVRPRRKKRKDSSSDE